jgi:polysaccharide export outer membrane protein
MTHKNIFSSVACILVFSCCSTLQAQNLDQPTEAVAGSAVAGTANPLPMISHPLQISSGDLLDLNVFDTPDLSGRFRVDERGEIAVPLAGMIQVSGLTAEQVARGVELRLREVDILKDPHVSVTVLEFATQGVTVMGEVKNPGVYPLLGARFLLDLISAAGGATPRAGKTVTITHRNDVNNPIVAHIGGAPGESAGVNIDIQPRDTIVVSRAGLVYVTGDVHRPGGFVLENHDQLTVLQAIALAEGTSKTAALSKAKIIHTTAAGRTEVSVSLKKIIASNEPDRTLYDGDILFVPSSGTKSTLQSMAQILPTVAGAAIYRIP